MLKISWSSLKTGLECGFRYEMKYLNCVNEREKESPASEYGNKMHEELLAQRKLQQFIPQKIIGTEVYVNAEKDGIIYEGIIDALAKDEEGYIVIDVKTYYPTEMEFLQVNFYAYLLSIRNVNVTNMYIFFTQTKELIKAEKIDVEQRIREFLTKLGTRDFKPEPGYHCRFCGYVEICPLQKKLWQKVDTMSPAEVLELYLYITELERRLQARLKELVKDNPVQYGNTIATIETMKSFKLKPKVEKEQIYSKYGLEAFEIDKDFLKQAEPSLFEIIEKKTLKITKKEE